MIFSDVLPHLTKANRADVTLSDAKYFSNCSLGKVAFSDRQHIAFSEFRCVDACSLRMPITTYCISDVVRCGPNAKVSGLYADASITRVQNTKSLCRAVVNSIRKHMRPDIGAVQVDFPVSMGVDCSRPVPTPLAGRETGGRGAWQEPPEDTGIIESAWSGFLDRPTRITRELLSSIVCSAKLFCYNRPVALRNETEVTARTLSSRGQPVLNVFWSLPVSLGRHIWIVSQYPGLKPKNFLEGALKRSIEESRPQLQQMLMGVLTGSNANA